MLAALSAMLLGTVTPADVQPGKTSTVAVILIDNPLWSGDSNGVIGIREDAQEYWRLVEKYKTDPAWRAVVDGDEESSSRGDGESNGIAGEDEASGATE